MSMLVVFDLNGTLTDPAGIGEPWGEPGLGAEAIDLAVQYAMTDTILGEHRDFADHLRGAVEVLVARRRLAPEGIDRALAHASRLPAWPDAAAALSVIADDGHRMAVLTNSSAGSGRATLEAAALADRFEEIVGVDAIGRFKPHPDVYGHALRTLGANPGETLLVAAHAWDVWGAKAAGLRTAWIARDEVAFPSSAPEPDIRASDLRDVAEQIAGLTDSAG